MREEEVKRGILIKSVFGSKGEGKEF